MFAVCASPSGPFPRLGCFQVGSQYPQNLVLVEFYTHEKVGRILDHFTRRKFYNPRQNAMEVDALGKSKGKGKKGK